MGFGCVDVPTDASVLVLGGNGFIGRHAVAALLEQGARVTIGSRVAGAGRTAIAVQVEGVQVEQVRLHKRTRPQDWQEIVQHYDVVLNCVGILRQRWGESYAAVHHLAPAALASACASQRSTGKTTRFIQVSALGLTATARSRFLSSKWRGDEAVLATIGECVVARLSLLDGEGGFGASWLRAVARLPAFIEPKSAKGKIAALTAADAGQALAELCLNVPVEPQSRSSRLFELGGAHSYSFADYIIGLRRRYATRPALKITVPGWLARLAAHLCDQVHFSPFSFGHWELLCSDNVPTVNRLPELLGRAPEPVIDSAEVEP